MRIRDNGPGIAPDKAQQMLTSLGASEKEGLNRGFRGIGRLSALAFCRRLEFRCASAEAPQVLSSLVIDSERLRQILSDPGEKTRTMQEVMHEICTFSQSRLQNRSARDSFFEVVLHEADSHGTLGYGNGRLIGDHAAVWWFLSMAAPVPFDRMLFSVWRKYRSLLSKGGAWIPDVQNCRQRESCGETLQ